MKSLFITALTLLAVLGYSQEAAKPAPSFKRVYVGVSTTQGVGYRLLSRNPNVGAADGLENVRDYIISSRNDREKPGYAANAGIRVGVNVTKFFAVETGIEYARRAYSWKMDNLIFGYQWDGTQYVPSNNTTAKFNSSYHYIDIPLSFNFNIGNKKVRTAINAGHTLICSRTEAHALNIPKHRSMYQVAQAMKLIDSPNSISPLSLASVSTTKSIA